MSGPAYLRPEGQPPVRARPVDAAAIAVVALTATTAVGATVQLSSPTARLNGSYGKHALLLTMDLTAASLVLAAALIVGGRRPRATWGLAVVQVALLAPVWAAWPAMADRPAVWLLALRPLMAAGIAWLAGLPVRVAVLSVPSCIVLALGYNPFADPACWEICADVRPFLADIARPGTLLSLGIVLALVATVVVLLAVARPRHVMTPQGRLGILGALVLLTASELLRLLGSTDPDRILAARVLPALAAVLAAGVVLVSEVRLLRTRRATERLLAGLAAPGSELLGSASEISSVVFAVRDPDSGADRWVDGSGTELPAPAGRTITLTDPSGPIVMLELAEHADRDGVLAALPPGTRLALKNAQLAIVGRARLAEVQASRRRIVSTTDAERHRIERDLHDGAQQRLVSVSLHLQIAIARLATAGAGPLNEADRQVRQALAGLRHLTLGVPLSVLADDDLAIAVEDLAARSGLPVDVDVQVGTGLDLDAAVAAYVTIADALAALAKAPSAALTRAGSVIGVQVRDGGPQVSVRLAVPVDPDVALTEIVDQGMGEATDRVTALGGTLVVSAGVSLVEVVAVIPCGS